ncbi:I78 family peptidase inhibitor [Sphingomonas sp. LY160]|uniref:I78 family peptidase inhibitor n=1 Tax=Sphingomonas sp. LY160 TaxID=3095342 RepID=UPI002ADED6A1|nr:I78 family peptidase inhibitor [Sphingomonas sp. LY160]MEA1071326.1 I78 family peptidase inhibitor [Sphingomonas sp. LY160]
MRHLPFALAALPLAACTTNMTDPPVAGDPAALCRGDGLASYVGQPATQDLGARMLRETGARTIRWVPKGGMVTMDFRGDRLTVQLDEANRVERASCG